VKSLVIATLFLMSLSVQAQIQLKDVTLVDYLSADSDEGQTEYEFPCVGQDGEYSCGDVVQIEDQSCAASLDWKVRKGQLVCELKSGEVIILARVPSTMQYAGVGGAAHYSLQYNSRVSVARKNGKYLLRVQD
jgi:hypothetical protein